MKRTFPLFAICAVLALPAHAQDKTQDMGHDLVHEKPVPPPADMPTVKIVVVMDHDVVPITGQYVVTNDVNVRKGPSTKFKRIGGLLEGERVRAIGKSEDGDWMEKE